MAKRNVPGVIDSLRSAVVSTFDDKKEYFGYTVKYALERAINDALLGNGSEQKPVAKPRKKRKPRQSADERERDTNEGMLT